LISRHLLYPDMHLGWQSSFCSQLLFLLGSYFSQQVCKHYLHFCRLLCTSSYRSLHFDPTATDTMCHVCGMAARRSLQSSHC
jgi:hypothetical protein